MEYLNFDILFERSGKKYRARLINSPGGQAEIEFRNPFSALELENFFLKIGLPRRSKRRSMPSEIEITKQFGGQLFETIFDKTVRECLRSSLDEAKNQGKGLRLCFRLTSTPELADLPWEFLYNVNTNRFLSLSTETPIVRYLDLPERVRKLIVKPPLKILVMISSPDDYSKLNTELEWHKLKGALRTVEEKRLVIAERLNLPTLSTLKQQLRKEKYHILHFIGHGEFDKGLQDGILILEDEEKHSHPISGEQMGTLLKDHHTLRLTFLNACEGARTSNTNPFAGTAQSLVQQGIPAVIAMQFEITDDAAITLAQEFYTILSEGYPVDTALAEARKTMYVNGNKVEWGNPILYMRSPNGRLFDLEQTTKQQKSEMLEKKQAETIHEKENSVSQTFIDQSIKEDIESDTFSELKSPDQKSIKNRNIKIFLISIIIFFLISLSAIILLNNMKLSSTLVELQLPVSEFSFKLMDKWDIYSLDANSIHISNQNNLEMEILSVKQAIYYDPETNRPIAWREFDSGDQLIVKRAMNNWGVTIESDYLNLTNLFIEAGSQIRISKPDRDPSQVKIRISDGSVFGSLDTGDTILLSCSNCEIENGLEDGNHPTKTMKIATFNNQIEFKDLDQSLQLELDLQREASNAEPILLGQNIPIQSIEFVVMIVEKLHSTIAGKGVLSLLEIDDKKIHIHEGDFLLLEGIEKFQVKKLQIDGQLMVTLNGRIREIKTGVGNNIRSHMPSIFEKLFANHFPTMIIFAILELFLCVLAVFYTLKVSPWG